MAPLLLFSEPVMTLRLSIHPHPPICRDPSEGHLGVCTGWAIPPTEDMLDSQVWPLNLHRHKDRSGGGRASLPRVLGVTSTWRELWPFLEAPPTQWLTMTVCPKMGLPRGLSYLLTPLRTL